MRLLLLLACLLAPSLALAAPAPDAPAQAVEVSRLSIAERSDGLGYVVRVHTNARVGSFSPPAVTSGALTLELRGVRVAPGFHTSSPSGPIRSLSAEPTRGGVNLRLALDPARPVEARAYPDRDTPHVLIALTYAGPAPAAAPPIATRPVAAEPAAHHATPAPYSGSNAGVDRWHLDTVVIDAGHGGKDPGAVANGVREKDVALAVALQAGRYIEERLGIRVVYTRSTDRFIELKDRGRIANEAGGKLFISVHANAASRSSARGTETFFLGLHKTDAAQAVMERENGVVQLEASPDAYTHFDDASLILHQLTQSTYLRKSEALATLIEGQFTERVGRKSRGVKQAGFYVLWGASMPAVLVELGFLTNRSEARYLASQQGQDYMASAIFRAVRAFQQDYERELTSASAR